MLPKYIFYILPNFYFMCLIDVKYLSKNFEMLLRDSSSFVGVRLFEFWQNVEFSTNDICKNNMFKHVPWIFLVFLGLLVSPNMKMIGLGAW